MLVGQRRRLLDYLKKKNVKRYRDVIGSLGIRSRPEVFPVWTAGVRDASPAT